MTDLLPRRVGPHHRVQDREQLAPTGDEGGGDAAIVDREKLTEYCLNPEHPRGKHKARVFSTALGFTAENARRSATPPPDTAGGSPVASVVEFSSRQIGLIGVYDNTVPEPATCALVSSGLLGLWLRHRVMRRAAARRRVVSRLWEGL